MISKAPSVSRQPIQRYPKTKGHNRSINRLQRLSSSPKIFLPRGLRKISPFAPPERLLMGPGPSQIHPRVLSAMSRPTLGHLDPEFIKMMDEIKVLLQYAFQTRNSFTIPISGPGSAGMEFCFVNLVEPGTKVIVCQNGVFGVRMKENVERCGGIVVMVENKWSAEPFILYYSLWEFKRVTKHRLFFWQQLRPIRFLKFYSES